MPLGAPDNRGNGVCAGVSVAAGERARAGDGDEVSRSTPFVAPRPRFYDPSYFAVRAVAASYASLGLACHL